MDSIRRILDNLGSDVRVHRIIQIAQTERAKVVIFSLVIYLIGLAIRTDPNNFILSIVAWYSFIYGCVYVYCERSKTAYSILAVSLIYNAWYHYLILVQQ